MPAEDVSVSFDTPGWQCSYPIELLNGFGTPTVATVSTNPANSASWRQLPPGQEVPESGSYECDAGDSHRWSVNVRGNCFPPLPDGCKGHGWVLKNTTAAAEALQTVSKVVPGVETSKDH